MSVFDISWFSNKRYKSDYKTVLYDLNEITAESVDMALKDLNVLTEDSEFYSFKLLDGKSFSIKIDTNFSILLFK